MGISHYLAMTAAEIAAAETLPEKLAYMACHFSPYGTGLMALAQDLPRQAMLILNDRIPFCGHDHQKIAAQLAHWVDLLGCSCLLLDFQRQDTPIELVRFLLKELSLPIGVAAEFAKELRCPVFLPPVPPDVLPESHIAPWAGREIWLDAATEAVKITVGTQGSHREQSSLADSQLLPFTHDALCCRYGTKLFSDRAVFTLQRTSEELPQLLEKAEALGVTAAISLYQEIKKLPV